MSHCNGRGDELLAGDQSHIILYEQGSAAQVMSWCKSFIRYININFFNN